MQCFELAAGLIFLPFILFLLLYVKILINTFCIGNKSTICFQFQMVICQRVLSSCDVTAENLAKMMIVQSQLTRRGAQPRHVAEVLNSTVGKKAMIIYAAVIEEVKSRIRPREVLLFITFRNCRYGCARFKRW